MTYIQQSGTGPGNEYLILETATGSQVSWVMTSNIYKSSWMSSINSGDWTETYKSSAFDAVHVATGLDNNGNVIDLGWVLKPNRKILLEFQLYFDYFATYGVSGKYVKMRFGLLTTTPTGPADYTHPKSELLSPTYHMENNGIMGATSNTASTYKAIISHSEASAKHIVAYIDSDSDQNINTNFGGDLQDSASKIKITQLD